jgi:hypothetical protein
VANQRIVNKGVAIDDLDDFRRDLQRLVREGGPDGLSLLKAANYRVAEHVRTRAVARAAGVGKQSLRAAQSMRSSKSTTRATLTGGNNKVPFFGGAEFGTKLGIRRDLGGRSGPNPGIGWLQFRNGAGNLLEWNEPGQGKTGYFLFPTMRAETAAIKEMYTRELDDICKIAFPNGRL